MREIVYILMDIEELVVIFDIKKNEYNVFKKILKMMEYEGIIRRIKINRYMIVEGEEY